MALAAIPFRQIAYFSVGPAALHVFELLSAILIVIVAAKLLAGERPAHPWLAFALLFVFVAYIGVSTSLWGANFQDVVYHLRIFLPFVAAVLILVFGTSVPLDRWLAGLVLATIVSATSAVLIYVFTPMLATERVLGLEPGRVSQFLQTGRLVWGNAGLIFFVMTAWMIREHNIPRPVLTVALAISGIAVFLAQNRTVVIGLVLFAAGAAVLSAKSKRRSRSWLALVLGVVLFLVALVGVAQTDTMIGRLVNSRFFRSGDLEAVFDSAVLVSRGDFYSQYAAAIRDTGILGAGLGRPISASSTGKILYNSDISLVNLWIPLGLVGVALLVALLWTLGSLIRRSASLASESQGALLLLLVVVAVVSANLDLLVKSPTIIFLSVIAYSSSVWDDRSSPRALAHGWTEITGPPGCR